MKTVEMPIDGLYNSIPVTGIKPAKDYDAEVIINVPDSCIVRVLAIDDTRVWNYDEAPDGDGVMILSGSVEYFALNPGSLKISGKANIMFYKKND